MPLATENYKDFERGITELTRPINGQLPRPWMTRATRPEACDVFLVGKNQRHGYPSESLSHKRHVDGLFNRSGETCRGIYDEMTSGRASPTRKNTDRLVDLLSSQGVTDVLETNVICYSSPMSADLRQSKHSGGAARGEKLFRFLLGSIKPRVLIVHGAGASKKLVDLLRVELPPAPRCGDAPSHIEVIGMHIFVIPSLAPPAWNRWSGWAEKHLKRVVEMTTTCLSNR